MKQLFNQWFDIKVKVWRAFVAKARQQLLNTDTYIKIGNTMYCIFDDFGPADSKALQAGTFVASLAIATHLP